MSSAYGAELALHIDGEWIRGGGRDEHGVLNPASGDVIAALPLATLADLDRALDAAAAGYPLWRSTPSAERSAVLSRAAALMRERLNRIATILTMEQGKPLAEARGEVAYSAALIDWYAAEAMRAYGRIVPRTNGSRASVLREPVGPSVAFCPWNFPVLNPVRKIAPALAAGCSLIMKPAEETPGSAVEVLRCFVDAGVPAKVLGLVFGVPDLVSRHLIASPIIRKISFTGSVPVGKHLMKLAADGMKLTTMELGGHAPVLVFDDCDLDRTVTLLVAAKFRNAGQVCVSPTRFFVQEGVYERFADAFARRAESLAVGDGLTEGTSMGPLANGRRPDAISALVDDAKAFGARVAVGGERHDGGGYFYRPTVLVDVPADARAMSEEPFGPLALMRPFKDLDEAVAQANALPFGLAAYCFTENGHRQRLLADAIESGMVGINSTTVSSIDVPFGGVKESGHGREDGSEGMHAFMVTKTVHEG